MKTLGLIFVLVLAFARVAVADEQFYDGELWNVSFRETGFESVIGATSRPSCQVTSKLWADRQVVLLYSLSDADHGIFALALYKKSWNLTAPNDPAKSPIVTILNGATNFKTAMIVQTPNTLLTGTPTSSDFSLDLKGLANGSQQASQDAFGFAWNLLTMQGTLFNEKQQQGLYVAFTGSEQPWSIPAIDGFDAAEISKAINQCQLKLTNVTSEQAPANPTSPMPDADPAPTVDADTPKPPVRQPSDNLGTDAPTAEIADNWKFTSGDEDWGKTCFVEATGNYGKVKVGFTGAPGKDLIPYVSGVLDEETKATWQVDNKSPYTSQGGENDYFGWYEFGDLPRSLLADVGAGNESLSIATDRGKSIKIGLTGAASAVAAFEACFGG